MFAPGRRPAITLRSGLSCRSETVATLSWADLDRGRALTDTVVIHHDAVDLHSFRDSGLADEQSDAVDRLE